MTALRYGISDTLVLAQRSLLRIPRQPDLLVGFTVQPILFVLLFVYVFGGAIQTPGFDYVDFLMPGIIVMTASPIRPNPPERFKAHGSSALGDSGP